MARIRSVHPGQWTAGDFLECSPLARLLALALRNVADDHGAFRWKPKTLKAECLPADNCDIDALLSELTANHQVQRYTIEGKEYGLIVDFTQWQRPKKPKYLHPIPPEFSTSTVPVPNEDDTDTENSPQRKEVGGIDSGVQTRERATSKSLISEEAFTIAGDLLEVMGLDREHPLSVGAPMTVQSWLNGGWPAEVIKVGVQKAMQNRKNDPPTTLKYFEKAIARTHAEMNRPLPIVEIREAEKLTVAHGQSGRRIQETQSLSDVARRHAAEGISFGERPTVPSVRVIAGSSDVRLLPQGGGERPGDLRGSDSGGPERISAGDH